VIVARIFLITGAPGSGKSTLLRTLGDIREFPCEIVAKITTRRRRDDDGAEIRPVDHANSVGAVGTRRLLAFVHEHALYYSYDRATQILTLRGPMPFEELKQLKQAVEGVRPIERRRWAFGELDDLLRRANSVPSRYDFVYEQYGVRYGFASGDVIECLRRRVSPIVIVNDIRVLREVKEAFGPQAVCIFVFSAVNRAELESLQRVRRATDATGRIDRSQIDRRIAKAEVILRRYIENIELFDHVVVNSRHTPDELRQQMEGIVRAGHGDRFPALTVAASLDRADSGPAQ
jgi:guanylate kinase